MQRVLLIVLLAMVSSDVAAAWIKVNENAEFTTYGDPSTIHKKGYVANMQSMFDFKAVQTLLADSAKYASTKQTGEYDCRDERTKLLTSTLFAKGMARGRVVHRYKLQLEWQTLKANSPTEALWKLACGKKVSHAE